MPRCKQTVREDVVRTLMRHSEVARGMALEARRVGRTWVDVDVDFLTDDDDDDDDHRDKRQRPASPAADEWDVVALARAVRLVVSRDLMHNTLAPVIAEFAHDAALPTSDTAERCLRIARVFVYLDRRRPVALAAQRSLRECADAVERWFTTAYLRSFRFDRADVERAVTVWQSAEFAAARK